ncbi:MAG: hypothetical protein EBX52_05790, partial [Proteobacteria bacterium]|nr:hypothetical protein [Pseudomonadota bacterium]
MKSGISINNRLIAAVWMTLFTASSAYAVDSNCNKYREKWPDGSYKQVNGSWSRDFFVNTQKSLVTQQKALKLYDDEVGDCLRKTSGVGFVDGNLTILDETKFKTFRLSGTVPHCNISTIVYTSSFGKDRRPYSTSDTILETALHGVGDPKLRAAITKNANRNAFDENQDKVRGELGDARNTLKGLQDLSLKNYCSQEFFNKNLHDEYKRLKDLNAACLKKFRADPGSIKGDKQCAGHKLYAPFANDAAALDKAIADAKAEYAKKSKEYETIRINNAVLAPRDLGTCDKDAGDAASVFNHALCARDSHPATNLKAFIADPIKTMDAKNRKDLINDANKRIFSNVVEGAVQTGSPAQLKKLATPSSSAAGRIAKLKAFCAANGMALSSKTCTSDEYAKILESSSKKAASKHSSHFLAQSDTEVSAALTDHFKGIISACDMPEGPDREAEVRHLTEKLYGDQKAGPFALSDTMRSFTDDSYQGGCGSVFMLKNLVQPANMLYYADATRKEFAELSKDQLQTCAENGLSDFGYQDRGWITKMRNNVGAMECSADLQDKNAMTALYDQFVTYPAVMAESLKGLPEQDRQIYSRVICKAMNCHQDIKSGNAAIVNAARMTILTAGIIATGGAAELAILGTAVAVEAVNGVQKTNDLNHEKEDLLKGVSSGGYPSSAWINDKIH